MRPKDQVGRGGVVGEEKGGGRVSLQVEGQELRPAKTSPKAKLHSWAGLVYSQI